MIDVERLVEAPWRQEVELPVVTDTKAERLIEATIDHVVAYIRKPFRLSVCYGHTLFSLTSDEYTKIREYGDDKQEFKVEPDRIQRIGMEVMRRYGFHEEVYGKDEKRFELSDLEEVTTSYPSETMRGLFFERVQTRNPKTGQVYEIEWRVNNRVSIIKFNPIEALRRNN